MTRAGSSLGDPSRRRRLRALTRLTVLAWVTAMGLAIVPVVAGGAGAGSPPTSPGLDAKPEGTPTVRTAKPTPSAKPHPTRKPRPVGTPQPTATPSPTPRATAHPTPRPSHGNGGGQGKPSASPKSGGGGPVAGTNGNSGANGATSGGLPAAQGAGGGSGAGTSAARPSADAPFSVPGLGPGTRPRGLAGDGSESLFSGSLFLDFDLASSIDLLTPAALLALPGLLIIASLVAQIVGGILWIPITHRLLGDPTARPGGPRTRRR